MTPANECLLHIYSITPTINGEIFLSTERLLESQEYFSLSEKGDTFILNVLAPEPDEKYYYPIVDYYPIVEVKLDKEWFMSKLDRPLMRVYDIHSPEYMPLFIGEYIQHKINQQWSII